MFYNKSAVKTMDGNTNRAFFLWASAVAALMAMVRQIKIS